ncbi:MAG: ABC transporter permease [Sphaerochaeta sp.]|jgi:simple sugar transport system permease protein|nr:ABC transporter permease [Sphaerochaeta sp.]MCH3920257.1 ABC transporter permease [Sphaerochaeta sp.]MCI2045083.1 ABC transporter permease [Sphaerochaeta sp.]MCI2076512.1 ABC transporter permease [Sphaerochaeta sp.]MCI2097085.1 ABC transporter permease [Sphaerochaeta sp.]
MNSIIIDGMAFSLPLFIIAIGGIYSEGSGITNLALEGFLGFGAFCGGLAVALFGGSMPQGTSMYLAFAMAALGGMVFAMLHALLCIHFKADQVISGVVMNVLSAALTAFLANQINASVFGKASNKFMLEVSPRFTVPGLSRIPVLGGFFTSVYPFEVLIILVALVMSYVLYRTPVGMRIRSSGDNPQAVDAAGGNVARIRFGAVMTSGALAGLGGMCFAYSISTNFSPSIYAGFGYLSIAAMIFGNWRILPTFFACILFGFARSGGYYLVTKLELPSSYSDLVLTLPYVTTLVLLIFFSRSNRAPRALGEIYDKGKR